MSIELREFRQMLRAGQLYLEGTCCLSELNGYVSECAATAKFWQGHPALTQVAIDWAVNVERRWNEWGMCINPLTEEDFRQWLEEQLTLLRHKPGELLPAVPIQDIQP